MANEFTSHGFKFNVEGDDFYGNERDFDAVCDSIEAAMDAMAADAVATMHRAVTWDVEADAYTDPDDTSAIDLANTVCRNTLAAMGWERPGTPFIMIAAVI